MNSLTIAQLAQFSGVKPHTIRVWEQRYQALSPARTQGNTRTYSDLDLKRLLNIVSLMESEYKVSELCGMKDDALSELIENMYSLETNEKPNPFVSQLISAGMEFNERSFQKILSHCLLRFGVDGTYRDVIYPLLDRVGLMWSADLLPPAHQQFMCNLIRQKMLTATDALPFPAPDSRKWLLFLPEDEYHEMGLLFAHYLLRKNGEDVVYLGSSVPLGTLNVAIETVKPDCLLLFFVHYDFPGNVSSYLSDIAGIFDKGTIFISGNEKLIEQVSLIDQVTWLKKVDDMERIVQ
ncbi:MAG: MerR family transcriptional regulator [Daejeonella sp.]|uniref:MerR family transcriptional regulator n=1 Tax=Daejeonella sp. JGW-45 TaxID=3034148 RepID=UPI0023EC60D1|nr:MerR family transcriptional regulator [Daejeonella sp. JGW-45]